MLLIHPAATIPIVQLSVLVSQAPADLFALGRALSPLRVHGIAIVGSGSASFHNLRLMSGGGVAEPWFPELQGAWSEKVDEAVGQEDVGRRGELLRGWRDWEGNEIMHPVGGAEHFSPLVVCAGAAGDGVAEKWADEVWRAKMVNYYWK